jgi:hypothetical protein
MRKVVPEIMESNVLDETPFFFIGSCFERAESMVDAGLGESRGALRAKYIGAVLIPVCPLKIRVQGSPNRI